VRFARSLRLAALLAAGAALCAVAGEALPASGAPGAVSFRGGWESGTFAPWSTLQVEFDRPRSDSFQIVRSPVREGHYAARFTVRQGYSPFGWNESSMVGWASNERDGDDFYYAWSTLFPRGWREPAGWGLFLEWHSELSISPPVDLNARGNSIDLNIHSGFVDSNGGWTTTVNRRILNTLVKGRWHDFVVHVHWSSTADGSVEVWHRLAGADRFDRVAAVSGVPTLQSTAAGVSGIYTLWGLYRASWCKVPTQPDCQSASGVQPPNSVYQDGFARATSFDAAVGAAFGPRTAAPAWPDSLGRESVGSAKAVGNAGFVDVSGPYGVVAPTTVTGLAAYLGGGSSTSSLRAVVYADDGGRPGELRGVTAEATIAAGEPPGWRTLAFRRPLELPKGKYWLGYWYGGTGAVQYFDNVPGVERYAAAPYSTDGEPSAQWRPEGTSSSSYSLYAIG
jgi:hypothetical protein